MSSEAETPLLTPQPTENTDFDYVTIYNRFSPRQKMVLLAIISWCGLIPLLISESFVLLVPQIAKDLDTTPQAVSLSISLSIFASALGGLSGGTYATFYGRRPVYLSGLVLLIIGSLGVGCSRSIAELMFCRFFQVFGASPGASVGAGVIGDIYELEQRGAAMGVFLAAILLGPTLAPLAGETSHPGTRGMDKVKIEGIKPTGKLEFLNPLAPLWLLRSPLLIAVSAATFAVLVTDFGIALQYSERGPSWRMLPPQGIWYPEDRLRVTLFAAGTLVPFSILFFGLLNDYIPGKIGLVLNLICLCMNGVGVQMVLGPVSAYLVDIMHSRSAETIAANRGFRSALISIALTGTFPLINWIGIAPTYAIFALMSWAGFGILWCVICYGDRMRAWKDVGFTTSNS